MPLYHGSEKIKDLYIGGDKIKEAYLGSTLVYQSAQPHAPQTWSWYTEGTYTWSAPAWVKYVDIIVMGGGGSGGGWFNHSKGGRAGQVATDSIDLTTSTLTVHVGHGGDASSDYESPGNPGDASTVGALSAAGGSGLVSKGTTGEDGPTVTVHGQTFSGGAGGAVGAGGGVAAGGGAGRVGGASGPGGYGAVWIVGYDYRGWDG